MTTGFSLTPDHAAGWAAHSADEGGRVVQLPDGVRLEGGADLGPDTGLLGLWSFLDWHGDFELLFTTRLLRAAPGAPVPLWLHFGTVGRAGMPTSPGAWDAATLASEDGYARLTRGARLRLYAPDPDDPARDQGPAGLDILDGTGTPKAVLPERNHALWTTATVPFRWRLVRTGTRLTLEQRWDGGPPASCRWDADLVPQFAGEGGFGIVVPAGTAVEILDLDVVEPDPAEGRTPPPAGPWRFGTDPTVGWTLQAVGPDTLIQGQSDGVRIVAGNGPDDAGVAWARTRPDADWRFSWRVTWRGAPASNNGPSGAVSLLCYAPADGGDPNAWGPSPLSLPALAGLGAGLAVRLAVQDADVPDRNDTVELAVLQGDGTVAGIRPDGPAVLGLLPDVEYAITVEKAGNTVTVVRSSAGSATRAVGFTAADIGLRGGGWIGLHVAAGREALVTGFDAAPRPSRLRGGKRPVAPPRPAGDAARTDLPSPDSLAGLAGMVGGGEYVVTAPTLDLGGATYPLSGIGRPGLPLTLRGGSYDRDPATFPVLRDGTLEVSAVSLLVTGLVLENVQLLLRQGTRSLQVLGNWFRGLTGGADWAAIVAAEGEDVVDVLIAHNLVAPAGDGTLNRGGFLDVRPGVARASRRAAQGGARRFTVERNVLDGFEADPVAGTVPIPVRLGRAGPDFDRNVGVWVRWNRVSRMLLPPDSPWIESSVGGVEITDNTVEVDVFGGGFINSLQGRLTPGFDLPPQAGVGTVIDRNLFVSPGADAAGHGIAVGGGYAKVRNNRAVVVADPSEQPTLSSLPTDGGVLVVLSSPNDWRTSLDETGPRSAGKAAIGGNLLRVLEGQGDGIPPDSCVIATDDPDRPDRNGALIILRTAGDYADPLEAGPVTGTDRETPVPDADFSLVPTRLMPADVGIASLPPFSPLPVAGFPVVTPLPAPPVAVVVPTPLDVSAELPVPLRQVYVASDAAYQAAIDDLQPGDEVVIADGLEVGYRMIDVPLPFAQPAVVRAESVGASRANGLDVAGANLIIHGIDLAAHAVTVHGERAAFFRCLLHGWPGGGGAQVTVRGQSCAFGHCDVRGQHGTTFRFDGYHGARRGHVFRCLFTDCDLSAQGEAGSLVELIAGPRRGVSLYHLIETSLFQDINQLAGDVDGTVMVDGSDNLVRFLQLSRARSIRVMGGRRNTVAGVLVAPGTDRPGNIELRGDDARCYGCVVGPNGRILVAAGNTYQDGYETGQGAPPAARRAWISDCLADVLTGHPDPSSPLTPALDSTIIGMRPGWTHAQTEFAHGTILLPHDPADPAYRETTAALLPSLVGSRAPWLGGP